MFGLQTSRFQKSTVCNIKMSEVINQLFNETILVLWKFVFFNPTVYATAAKVDPFPCNLISNECNMEIEVGLKNSFVKEHALQTGRGGWVG